MVVSLYGLHSSTCQTATDMGLIQERIVPTVFGSITSVQAV